MYIDFFFFLKTYLFIQDYKQLLDHKVGLQYIELLHFMHTFW